MKRYLFLAAWVEGSESSIVSNGVHTQADLLPRFQAGETEMISLVIEAPNETVAEAFAYRECWNANMTAHDSVSIIIELTNNDLITCDKIIKVDCQENS